MFLPYRSEPSVYPQAGALRRCGEQETGLSTQLAGGFSWWCSEAIGLYWRKAMVLTAIIVTALVFTGIGAGIGCVLGYIEAENFYCIKHGEMLPTLAQQVSNRSKRRQES